MINEIIETDKYIMRVHDDECMLEYLVKEDVTISAADVIAGKAALSKIRPGIKFFVIAEGIGFFTITKEAKEICATSEYADNTVAVAFYTTSTAILLMGEMYNKINKPVVPTKIFNNRELAQEWLKEQMRKTT
jgi:hypothetical protein